LCFSQIFERLRIMEWKNGGRTPTPIAPDLPIGRAVRGRICQAWLQLTKLQGLRRQVILGSAFKGSGGRRLIASTGRQVNNPLGV
jgi:hypothetical protein